MENNHEHIHIFKDVVIPPTCKEPGYTLHKCDCGYEHKDNFKPLGDHMFQLVEEVEPTCTEQGKLVLKCAVCSEVQVRAIPARGHAFGNWSVQKFPTCTEEGARVRFCACCGFQDRQIIEPIGHNLVLNQKIETEDGDKGYFCQNCGQIIKKENKFKKFLSRHKKGIIISVASILVVTLLTVLTVTTFIPEYHYSSAKSLIEQEKYNDAYFHLVECYDYKDTKDYLEHFMVYYGKTVCTNEDGEVVSVLKSNYDKNGKMLYSSITEYDEDGNEKYKHSSEYRYDENGNKILSDHNYCYDGKDERHYRYEYQYDEKGNLIVEKYYSNYSNTRTEYKYDEFDNVILEVKYDGSGKINEKVEKKYDSKGNLIYHESRDKDGKIQFDYDYVYEYEGNDTKKMTYYKGSLTEISLERIDDDGNTEFIAYYDANGSIISCTNYQYYENGRIKTVSQSDGQNNLKSKREYDEYGELIYYAGYDSDKIEREYDKKKGILKYLQDDEEVIVKIKFDFNGRIKEAVGYFDDGKIVGKVEFDKFGNQVSISEYDDEGKVEHQVNYEYSDPIIIYDPDYTYLKNATNNFF